MRGANLVLRFLLELSALAATAYWGFSTASGVTQWVLGLGAPALVAVVWGLFVSPKAKIELPHPAQFAIELLVLGRRGTRARRCGSVGARDRVRRRRGHQWSAELRLAQAG